MSPPVKASVHRIKQSIFVAFLLAFMQHQHIHILFCTNVQCVYTRTLITLLTFVYTTYVHTVHTVYILYTYCIHTVYIRVVQCMCVLLLPLSRYVCGDCACPSLDSAVMIDNITHQQMVQLVGMIYTTCATQLIEPPLVLYCSYVLYVVLYVD